VLSALESFENLEASRAQSLALHFEGASVLLRWIEGHVLSVLGTERVNPTVLTVNLNAAASKLSAMAAQGGGAAMVFRATLSGSANPQGFQPSASATRPSSLDPVPDPVLSQLTQLYAKPLGAVGRLSILQRLKSTRPTYGSFSDFVRSLAPTIDDPVARSAFLSAALELLPHASRVQSAAVSGPSEIPRAESQGAIPVGPPTPGVSTPSQKPGAPVPAKLKRTIVYRGRKVQVDD
jgi:hypothetical protein